MPKSSGHRIFSPQKIWYTAPAGDNRKHEEANRTEPIHQIFDKVFKRIITLSGPAVIHLISGLYDQTFPLDSRLTYHETESVSDGLERTISDTMITLTTPEGVSEKFHMEIEFDPDSTLVLRVFRYGFAEAIKHKKVKGNRMMLEWPHPKIIYLTHTSRTPDVVILDLKFGGEIHSYHVPVMKLLAHSVEELAARQMVILLPLYLLKCRKAAVKKPTKELAEELRKLIDEMIQTLDGRKTAGDLTGEDVRVLVSLLNRLYEYLYGHIQLFEAEGVNRMLADRLVLDVDIAKKKGREEGIEHGHTQGLEEVTLEMLKEGEPIDKIIRFTHFPRERIQALHDRL